MKKYLMTAVVLLSTSVFAKSPSVLPDVVQLIGPYSITAEQAMNSHVNLYVTNDSIATIGIDRGDSFESEHNNSGRISSTITKNKKAVIIKNNLKPGEKSTVAIITECGISISVTINSLDKKIETKEIKPKLQISSKACPEMK
ncbi:hypothetical protein F9817_13175 [Vibrio sp. CAIM 722]|uniref:Pilus formation protein N-terminal domain-containing protein n=1 Tax=Vibrio eleionomae TaxID=2653505 RepID=A0A7X4LLS7_9VIBR|nr:hypothetical protein [Vibrio eleionomae]MZI94145.1 hypothetical protein [Vibrio eleionomae]